MYKNVSMILFLDLGDSIKTIRLCLDLDDNRHVFLPPYSPNLNLIKHLWKFLKKELPILVTFNFQKLQPPNTS